MVWGASEGGGGHVPDDDAGRCLQLMVLELHAWYTWLLKQWTPQANTHPMRKYMPYQASRFEHPQYHCCSGFVGTPKQFLVAKATHTSGVQETQRESHISSPCCQEALIRTVAPRCSTTSCTTPTLSCTSRESSYWPQGYIGL